MLGWRRKQVEVLSNAIAEILLRLLWSLHWGEDLTWHIQPVRLQHGRRDSLRWDCQACRLGSLDSNHIWNHGQLTCLLEIVLGSSTLFHVTVYLPSPCLPAERPLILEDFGLFPVEPKLGDPAVHTLNLTWEDMVVLISHWKHPSTTNTMGVTIPVVVEWTSTSLNVTLRYFISHDGELQVAE